jgi:small subunit ribosomal protein S18
MSDVRYLTPISIEIKKEKYCRFRKSGIKYVDYKNPDYLIKFINEQGKILPRRLTGTSQKYQKKVNKAVKRARHLAILPYVADMMKFTQGRNFQLEILNAMSVSNKETHFVKLWLKYMKTHGVYEERSKYYAILYPYKLQLIKT